MIMMMDVEGHQLTRKPLSANRRGVKRCFQEEKRQSTLWRTLLTVACES